MYYYGQVESLVNWSGSAIRVRCTDRELYIIIEGIGAWRVRGIRLRRRAPLNTSAVSLEETSRAVKILRSPPSHARSHGRDACDRRRVSGRKRAEAHRRPNEHINDHINDVDRGRGMSRRNKRRCRARRRARDVSGQPSPLARTISPIPRQDLFLL